MFVLFFSQAIFGELCKMLDPGKPAFAPKKAKPSVVMFVGLQGGVFVRWCANASIDCMRFLLLVYV